MRSALAALALVLSLSACGGGPEPIDESEWWQPAPSEQLEEPADDMYSQRDRLCEAYTNSLANDSDTLTSEQFYNTTQAIEAFGCFTS